LDAVPASLQKPNNAGGYAPFAQLVKMLLPSAGSVAIYDPAAELNWCSDGYERPDLRELLERQRASDTLSNRGRVEQTAAGVPVFVAGLRGADTRPLGYIVIELGGGSSRMPPSMVVSMLRPVLDCLQGWLDREHSTVAADRSAGLDLLLSADERDRHDALALNDLLEQTVRELDCVSGALLVPDKNVELVYSRDESPGSAQPLDRTQKHLLAWVQLNNRPMVVNRAAGGVKAPYKILSCPVRDANGRVAGLLALFRLAAGPDFEARDVRILEFVSRKAVAILESELDDLTGLANRAIFERRAERALAEPGGLAVPLLYVDIDNVAGINEAFGFGGGDEVIQRVGDLVRRVAGPSALVTRIGGDRFAALLPGRTVAEAREQGNAIVAATSQLGFMRGAEALPVTVGVGVVAAAPGEAIAHLIAAGELACRNAKREGVGRCAVLERGADQPLAAAERRLAAEQIQAALQTNGFELAAQPIVSLRGRAREALGYELLIRLRGAAGELLAPDKFFAACERYGLMPALDRWTVLAAVDRLRAPGMIGDGSPWVAVNVSAQSLESRKYASFVLEALAAAGLDPAKFCFEIKEAAALSELAATEAFIREMTSAGAKVALDDFGSGLSSLAHLKRLPVHYLKIDGRIVRRMAADRIAESIVAAIAGAARTLGVATIAEHVESAAVAERLVDLEVDMAQGFHFGRPVPLPEVLEHAAPPLAVATRL
jgi:diguanylate cyclase (GGDEF)-like protein